MDDAALKALLAEDGLPERDPGFTYAVMRRVAARRAVFDIAGFGVLALAAAAVLWAVLPLVEPMLSRAVTETVAPWLVASVVALSILWAMGLVRMPRRMTET